MKHFKLAIIDIDGFYYSCSKDTLEESLISFDEKFENILETTGATHYVAFCSFSPYFRHDITESYKANRSKRKSTLKWIKTLRSYSIEKYGAQYMEKVEADDLAAYWMNQELCIDVDGRIEPKNVLDDATSELHDNKDYSYNLINTVLCSPDKDLLKSIIGKHFNYTYKLENREDPNSLIKGFWVETKDIKSINYFKFEQLIVGDSADNIKGIEGKGVKFAEKLFLGVEPNDYKILLSLTIEAYIDNYGLDKGVYEFQKNYRLLHLLNTDSDFIQEIGTPPDFLNVMLVKEEEVIDF